MAVVCFFVWYYPIGFYRNASATDTVSSRGLLAFLLFWGMFLFASSLAHLLIAGISSEDIAAAIATLIFIMMYAFCGILAGPSALPRFWIFMYRVNPLTYLVSSLMATTLGNAPAHCAKNEFQNFASPANQTCAEYLQPYISMAGGYVGAPSAQAGVDPTNCNFCQIDSTNQYLSSINIDFADRWWHFGLLWVYIIFNIVAAIALYWTFRVPKTKKI
jgi:ATP-binding cassette subfamily G (WHITE) protein 2 (PDR)